jgi:hypothetical protein
MQNGQSKSSINESTLLSIHVVVILVGLAIWLTKLSIQVEKNKEDIYNLEARLGFKERKIPDQSN